MSEFRCCCLFLLVKILTETGIASKFVCPGDSVQLFKMTNFDSCNAVVSLFVNGDRILLIAKWTFRNCTLNSSLLQEYKDKVYLDKNGTILLQNVHRWDEGRYIMKKEDTLTMTYEEQIYVMALPTEDCRPKIVQLGNSLSASLKHDACGKPLATQYWKDCCGVSYSNESVLKLSAGKDTCTCYACIASLALKCARNSKPLDYCSTLIIRGTNTPLETLDLKTVVFVAVGIILVISFLLVITLIAIIRRRRRNKNVRKKYEESKQSEESKVLLRRKGMQHSTVFESVDTKVRQRYKESYQPEKMHELSTFAESDDPNLRTEEASTKLQLIREEGTGISYCTFCRKHKTAMFVLPCEHAEMWYMPTCLKCGCSLKPCEMCMTERKNIWSMYRLQL